MIAEVIAIGDELTSGERLDTNSQWLSQRLTELGVEVRYHATAGDDQTACESVFRHAIERADIVVSTGGLGPTADDLTREAIAGAAGAELIRDQAVVEQIRQLFASRGQAMPDRNARQADFPAGATPIPNPHGTAPGVELTVRRPERGACRLFALPGVPAEMREMWAETVAPAVSAARPTARIIRHRSLKCFGVGESRLEAMLPDLIRRGREPRVGITASGATLTLRVTAAGADEAAALAAIEPTLETIREKLGVLVFGEEAEELQHVVARLLFEQRQTVATAESWTAGLLGGGLAATERGVLKLSQLAGEPAVGEAEVTALAERVRDSSGADYGLAVGAPDDGSPQSVAVALVANGLRRTKTYPTAGHPSILKPRAAKQALNLLRLRLLNHDE